MRNGEDFTKFAAVLVALLYYVAPYILGLIRRQRRRPEEEAAKKPEPREVVLTERDVLTAPRPAPAPPRPPAFPERPKTAAARYPASVPSIRVQPAPAARQLPVVVSVPVAPARPTPSAPQVARQTSATLPTRRELRRFVLWAEILGPPAVLRGPTRRR